MTDYEGARVLTRKGFQVDVRRLRELVVAALEADEASAPMDRVVRCSKQTAALWAELGCEDLLALLDLVPKQVEMF